MNGQCTLSISTFPEARDYPILWFWRSFLLFWWGCQSFHFVINNINPTSSTTITYSYLFLFTTASFHFLIYNINVTFSATLMYFNLFHFTTASFHFLICNLNNTFTPTLKHSNIFLFPTAWFNLLWYVSIIIWIGGVTYCSTCSGCFTHKTGFLGRRPRCTFLYYFSGHFNMLSFSTSAALCFLDWYLMIVSIKRHFSCKYIPSRQLNVRCMKLKNIQLWFIVSSFRTSMSHFPDYEPLYIL